MSEEKQLKLDTFFIRQNFWSSELYYISVRDLPKNLHDDHWSGSSMTNLDLHILADWIKENVEDPRSLEQKD